MGPSILYKLDGVLEYCQTSSSDLTLPPDLEDNQKPAYYAIQDIIEVDRKTKELLEAANELLIYEYGEGIKEKAEKVGEIPDEIKRLCKAIKKAEGDN